MQEPTQKLKINSADSYQSRFRGDRVNWSEHSHSGPDSLTPTLVNKKKVYWLDFA